MNEAHSILSHVSTCTSNILGNPDFNRKVSIG